MLFVHKELHNDLYADDDLKRKEKFFILFFGRSSHPIISHNIMCVSVCKSLYKPLCTNITIEIFLCLCVPSFFEVLQLVI